MKLATDPVPAIAPGVVAIAVELKAAGVGVANQVEPVASPALAVVRRGEKVVDNFFVGVGGGVVEKGADFGGRWGDADHVEIHAANQSAAVRFRGGHESIGFPGRIEEMIDRIGAGGSRNQDRGSGEWIGRKAQKLRSAAVIGRSSSFERVTAGSSFASGPSSLAPEEIHRRARVSMSGGRKLLAGRHGGLLSATGEKPKTALVRVAGDDSGSAFAAFEDGVGGAESRARTFFIAAPWHPVCSFFEGLRPHSG